MCNHLRSSNMESGMPSLSANPIWAVQLQVSMQAISRAPNQHGAERAALLDASLRSEPSDWIIGKLPGSCG